MQILEYQPGMLDDLTAVYNGAVEHVPHCYPVRAETFAPVLHTGGHGLRSEAVMVATTSSEVQGFIHMGVKASEGKSDRADQGVIRFFWYAPGQRTEGQALLEAAEAHLREQGVRRVVVCPQEHRYPFYHLDHAYLSDHLGHVQALLGFNGYRKVSGEVYFDWTDYAMPTPAPATIEAEIRIERHATEARLPDVHAQAYADGKRIGTCVNVSGGHFSESEPAQLWTFTEWLGVEDEWQGQGLGRHLLQCALQEAYQIGYRHAGISTDWENYRAFVFYSNAGYHVVDWTYAFGRELS